MAATLVLVANKANSRVGIEFLADGRNVAIEVKGTTAAEFPAVEITANEWAAAANARRLLALPRDRLLDRRAAHCASTRPIRLARSGQDVRHASYLAA